MKKHIFLKNAAILSVTSLILKTVGIFFRIYLSDRIGAEGMGLYQLIVSVYVLGSTFASSGLSTATTRLITDELVCGDPRSVRRILRRALSLSTVIAVLSTLLFYLGAPLIGTYWIRDARAVPAIRVLSLSFPFMGVSSCIKGYFMARRRVASSSRAQLLEQFTRMAVIFGLFWRFSSLSLTAACAAVMVGDTVSEAISCGYISLSYLWDRRRLRLEPPPRTDGCTAACGIVRRILSIAVPVTAGRYLNSLLRTAENLLVPQRLSLYADSREAGLSQFGTLKGMAMPLIFFPSSFLSAFSTLLIPEMSEARALGQTRRVQRVVDHTLHITLLASLLIGGLFWLLAYPLGELLYHSREVGFLLRVLAPLIPVMYVESVVDGILKGLNQQVSSLKYSVADSALRILLIVFLVPLRGMAAFLFIMILSNLFTCGLNVRRLCTVTGTHIRFGRWILRPLGALCAGLLAASGLLRLCRTLPVLPQLMAAALLTVGCYIPLLFACGSLSRDELRLRA